MMDLFIRFRQLSNIGMVGNSTSVRFFGWYHVIVFQVILKMGMYVEDDVLINVRIIKSFSE